jgi:hypothetical protein
MILQTALQCNSSLNDVSGSLLLQSWLGAVVLNHRFKKTVIFYIKKNLKNNPYIIPKQSLFFYTLVGFLSITCILDKQINQDNK